MKECSKSTIFKVTNPWVHAILSILREIYDFSATKNINNSQSEILQEIEILFKALGINNLNEVLPNGFIKAL